VPNEQVVEVDEFERKDPALRGEITDDETGTRMALAKLAAFVEARRFPRAPRLELLSAS
jgi:hypothetical protein